MMVIFLSLTALFASFMYSSFFFFPFFLSAYLYIFYPRITFPLIFIFCLLFDLWWVLPLGSNAVFQLMFILVLHAYRQKFNFAHQGIIFVFLVIFSVMYALWRGVGFSFSYLFTFSVCFLLLSLRIRMQREDIMRSI